MHRQIVETAVRAELLEFDSVWLGEHHLCDYVLSSPPVVLAAIAGRTTRLRLGTGVTLLGSLDPVRVAEDYATLDGALERTRGDRRGPRRAAPHHPLGADRADSLGQREPVAARGARRGHAGDRAGVELLLQGPSICGSVAEVADRIAAMRSQLGLDLHIAMFDRGGIPEAELADALERFAADVIPVVTR